MNITIPKDNNNKTFELFVKNIMIYVSETYKITNSKQIYSQRKSGENTKRIVLQTYLSIQYSLTCMY